MRGLSAAILLLLILAGCRTPPGDTVRVLEPGDTIRPGALRSAVAALAHDSMAGRETGTPGARRAERYLVTALRKRGVSPAYDDGYVQRVPLVEGPPRRGSRRLFFEEALPDTVAPGPAVEAHNLVGLIPGGDPELRDQAVIISAHYDHEGVDPSLPGDSIYNGADDDASGVAAVLEMARALAEAPPARSIVVLLTSAEEYGVRGARWYADHPVVPLEKTVAALMMEVIGRPDPKLGPGQAWLTGFDRSSIGDRVRDADLPIGEDPRPHRRFYFSADNIALARRGVPAHTISSFGGHQDYHRPSDEAATLDPIHMVAVTQASLQLVRILADGPPLTWVSDGRPEE